MLGKWTGGGWGGICLPTHSLCDRMSAHTADMLIHCASGCLLKNSKVKVGVWVLVLLWLLSVCPSLHPCILYLWIRTIQYVCVCDSSSITWTMSKNLLSELEITSSTIRYLSRSVFLSRLQYMVMKKPENILQMLDNSWNYSPGNKLWLHSPLLFFLSESSSSAILSHTASRKNN